jgi:hypothetical protein
MLIIKDEQQDEICFIQEKIPTEMQQLIVHYMPWESFHNMALVSKYWNSATVKDGYALTSQIIKIYPIFLTPKSTQKEMKLWVHCNKNQLEWEKMTKIASISTTKRSGNFSKQIQWLQEGKVYHKISKLYAKLVLHRPLKKYCQIQKRTLKKKVCPCCNRPYWSKCSKRDPNLAIDPCPQCHGNDAHHKKCGSCPVIGLCTFNRKTMFCQSCKTIPICKLCRNKKRDCIKRLCNLCQDFL